MPTPSKKPEPAAPETRTEPVEIRRIIFLALLLALATAGHAAERPAAEPPTSFRGLEWGLPLSDAPELRPVGAPGFRDTYYRDGERLNFGDAEIVSVAYYFREDRLYRVGVAFAGRANHFLIKERLLRMYGQGRGVGARYGWMWPDFSVELTFDDDADRGGLYFTHEARP